MSSNDRFQKSLQMNLAKHLTVSNSREKKCPRALTDKIKSCGNKLLFEQTVNESELFKTSYYEDISDGGVNIDMKTDPQQLNRILGKASKKQGSDIELKNFFEYTSEKRKKASAQRVKKFTQYELSTVPNSEIAKDLQNWLPFYCNVCRKYETGEHNSHSGRLNRTARKFINIKQIDFFNALGLLQIKGQAYCNPNDNCVFNLKQSLIDAANTGRFEPHLLQSKDKADAIAGIIQKKLSGMRSAILPGTNYCMLKIFLMERKLSCLELYFCVRKILGESPLDLDVLEKSTNKPAIQPIPEDKSEANEEVQIVNVSYKPKISKFAMSKSTVCDGAGIFATEDISRGSLIGYYLGEIIDTEKDSYNIRTEYQRKMSLGSYSFDIKVQIQVDSSFYGNFTRMINHMPQQYANCKFKTGAGNNVSLIATKDIEVDDQLFVDYGAHYNEPWREQFDKIIKNLQGTHERSRIQESQENSEPATSEKSVEEVEEIQEPPPRKRQKLFWCVKSSIPSKSQPEVIEID